MGKRVQWPLVIKSVNFLIFFTIKGLMDEPQVQHKKNFILKDRRITVLYYTIIVELHLLFNRFQEVLSQIQKWALAWYAMSKVSYYQLDIKISVHFLSGRIGCQNGKAWRVYQRHLSWLRNKGNILPVTNGYCFLETLMLHNLQTSVRSIKRG